MIRMHLKLRFLLVVSSFFISNLKADSWNGTDYVKNSSLQLSHAEYLLQNLSFKGDETLLDLGCGDGKITARLAEKVPDGVVVGIDPSHSMLDQAKHFETDRLSFLPGSAETFQLDLSFDHILVIHVMHWVKEQGKALKNIFNHLKPGGQVHLIIAPSKEGLPFHTALQKTLIDWEEDFRDFTNPQQVYDMETYRRLMVDAGFHVDAFHYIFNASIHENKEKLKNWLKQWLPHGKHLPLDKQPLFLDQLMANYLIEAGFSPETEDAVEWGEYVLIVEGSKKTPFLN